MMYLSVHTKLDIMIGLHFLTALADIYYGHIDYSEVSYIAVSCYNPYGNKEIVTYNRYNVLFNLEFRCSLFKEHLASELTTSMKKLTSQRPERTRLLELIKQLEIDKKLVFIQEPIVREFSYEDFEYMKSLFPNVVNFSKTPKEGVWSKDEGLGWFIEPLKQHKNQQKRSFKLLKKIVSLIRFFSWKKVFRYEF